MNQSVSDVISIKPSVWTVAQVEVLLDLPFSDLIHRAQLIHRQYHDANAVQLSTLISVKTGGALRTVATALRRRVTIRAWKIRRCCL